MIRHLINVFEPREGSDLVRALPITIASMHRAREVARNAGLSVEQRAAYYPEDAHCLPAGFVPVEPLKRDCREFPALGEFPKLPLFSELVQRLVRSTAPDDILIYSNADIAIQPHFYPAVSELLGRRGCDAVTINRRTIGADHPWPGELSAMYADPGTPHPGSDCFVFRAAVARNFILTDVVVGTALFDKMLLWNLMAFASGFEVRKEDHLTFHLGNDQAWKSERTRPLRIHNRHCLRELLVALERSIGSLSGHPQLWREITAPVKSPNARVMHELLGFRPDSGPMDALLRRMRLRER